MPEGCGSRQQAALGYGSVIVAIELWRSPAAAAETRGCQLPEGRPDNVWLPLINHQPATIAFHHKGQAIDHLAAQLKQQLQDAKLQLEATRKDTLF